LVLEILSYIGAITIWWWGCQGAIAVGLSDSFAMLPAQNLNLSQRIKQYPNWHQPQFGQHEGELTYPEWFRGEWQATSTLLEQLAPLAPAVVTPGFEGNRQYLDRPISFKVRFIPTDANREPKVSLLNLPQLTARAIKPVIVADRAFNGLNIATAYLGTDRVKSVKVDPQKPTRQITQLAQDRQLVSFVTGFDREVPTPNRFIATEVAQQIFRGNTEIYLNVVETITSYQFSLTPTPKITATQISAIYLSPQDPDYFRALDPSNRPVALYKYHLDLVPIQSLQVGSNL
jgi:hypothetical protein